MTDKCLLVEERESGLWICDAPAHGTTPKDHYFVKRKPAICPECRAGKHGACLGDALDEQTDDITDCFCYVSFHGGDDA